MILNGSRQRIKDQSLVERINTLVIGAGIVGLATAKALAEQGRDVILLEKNPHFGEETSSRNSATRVFITGREASERVCAIRARSFYMLTRETGVLRI